MTHTCRFYRPPREIYIYIHTCVKIYEEMRNYFMKTVLSTVDSILLHFWTSRYNVRNVGYCNFQKHLNSKLLLINSYCHHFFLISDQKYCNMKLFRRWGWCESLFYAFLKEICLKQSKIYLFLINKAIVESFTTFFYFSDEKYTAHNFCSSIKRSFNYI